MSSTTLMSGAQRAVMGSMAYSGAVTGSNPIDYGWKAGELSYPYTKDEWIRDGVIGLTPYSSGTRDALEDPDSHAFYVNATAEEQTFYVFKKPDKIVDPDFVFGDNAWDIIALAPKGGAATLTFDLQISIIFVAYPNTRDVSGTGTAVGEVVPNTDKSIEIGRATLKRGGAKVLIRKNNSALEAMISVGETAKPKVIDVSIKNSALGYTYDLVVEKKGKPIHSRIRLNSDRSERGIILTYKDKYYVKVLPSNIPFPGTGVRYQDMITQFRGEVVVALVDLTLRPRSLCVHKFKASKYLMKVPPNLIPGYSD